MRVRQIDTIRFQLMFYKFDFCTFQVIIFFSFMIDFEDPVSVSYIIIAKFITVLKRIIVTLQYYILGTGMSYKPNNVGGFNS